jgi:hypothetical protein
MKTYTFQANCKNEQRAIEAAKDLLRDLREIPERFEIVAKKVHFYTFEIIAKKVEQ